MIAGHDGDPLIERLLSSNIFIFWTHTDFSSMVNIWTNIPHICWGLRYQETCCLVLKQPRTLRSWEVSEDHMKALFSQGKQKPSTFGFEDLPPFARPLWPLFWLIKGNWLHFSLCQRTIWNLFYFTVRHAVLAVSTLHLLFLWQARPHLSPLWEIFTILHPLKYLCKGTGVIAMPQYQIH